MLGIILLFISIYLFQKNRFFLSLLLFFLFITNGYQIIPINFLMMGLPLDKGTDLAIIYTIVNILLLGKKFFQIVKYHRMFIWTIVLLGFVSLSGIYSLLFLNYPLINVIQVYRPYLFLTSFAIFFVIPIPDLKRVFHVLAIITVVQSALFLLQIFTGETILLSGNGTNEITTNIINGGYIRFYNMPLLLTPTLFYFIFVFRLHSRLLHYIVITILTLAVVGPMHRSFILAIVAALSTFVIINQSSAKRFIYLSFIGLLAYAASYIEVVSNRLNEAVTDLISTASSNLSLQYIDINENTLLFRLGHMLERFDYILSKPFGWLFGIGLISDNSPLAGKLPFELGLTSEDTGQIVQVDTADLIWSPLFLTLGLVGTTIYVLVFLKYMVFFHNSIKCSKYSIVGFLTIITGFFISTTSTEMLSFTFRAIAMLLAVISLKQFMLARYLEARADLTNKQKNEQ